MSDFKKALRQKHNIQYSENSVQPQKQAIQLVTRKLWSQQKSYHYKSSLTFADLRRNALPGLPYPQEMFVLFDYVHIYVQIPPFCSRV